MDEREALLSNSGGISAKKPEHEQDLEKFASTTYRRTQAHLENKSDEAL
jgi:hypothetical protein